MRCQVKADSCEPKDKLMEKHVICGVDEAGRGSLVGEIYCAAVILDAALVIPGLTDSKKLTPKKRTALAEEIKARAIAWQVATASLEDIVHYNVLYATLRAMSRAVEGLNVRPAEVWVDGNQSPQLSMPVQSVVKGDLLIPAISAASILAKVERDKKMVELHGNYPEYGFDRHKGYLTKLHRERLEQFGPCPQHRVTFSPVREMLELRTLSER